MEVQHSTMQTYVGTDCYTGHKHSWKYFPNQLTLI